MALNKQTLYGELYMTTEDDRSKARGLNPAELPFYRSGLRSAYARIKVIPGDRTMREMMRENFGPNQCATEGPAETNGEAKVLFYLKKSINYYEGTLLRHNAARVETSVLHGLPATAPRGDNEQSHGNCKGSAG